MTTMEIGLILAGILLVFGAVQWKMQSGRIEKQKIVLEYAEKVTDMECRQREAQKKKEKEEEERQKFRPFGLDFMITHGSAFGGCSAINVDGRRRRGVVPLDHVLMYGKHPSGKEFTYYIEEQGLEICAADEKNCLVVRSRTTPFEIREAGMGRDQGVSAKYAVIKQDVLYYIILESRHEISIKATRTC